MEKLWGSKHKGISIEEAQEQRKEAMLNASIQVGEQTYIEVVSNHIYFYNEISTESILYLNKTIFELGKKLVKSAFDIGSNDPTIHLHINSGGGEIHAGFAGADAILTSEVPVVTIIDGFCASAATFLSVVGKNRLINKHSYMLIHQLSSSFWGKHEEFVDEMMNQKILMDGIKALYKEFTNFPQKKLDEILKKDIYISPKDCLKYGLVDAII